MSARTSTVELILAMVSQRSPAQAISTHFHTPRRSPYAANACGEAAHLTRNLFSNVQIITRKRSRCSQLEATSRRRNFCAEPVIIRPAAACDGDLRQRRLIWSGAAYRLVVAALPPLTYVASSLGYENDCLIRKLDGQGYQAQKSVQPVHRQFTSLRERRRCRFAGLTPLTFPHYSCSEVIYQTYVRVVATLHQQESSTVTAPQNKTKMPGDTPRRRDSPPCVERSNHSNGEPQATVHKLQPMLPKLLQEVSLKTLAHAEKQIASSPRLSVCVFDRFEFERADVVGNLRKTVSRRRRIAINNRLF